MPGPERDLVTRLLAAIVGGLLGAFLGFLLASGPFRSPNHADPPILAFVWGAAAIAFVGSFGFGDSAVRFLLRVLGGWGSRPR